MQSKYKPLIAGVVTLGALDMTAIVIMIANPALTARVIPALVAIQILGFIAIPVVYLSRRSKQTGTGESHESPSHRSKEWAIWLFSGLAMIYLFRALLALAYVAAHGWHRRQTLVPAAGIAITCYLLYLAFAIRKRMRTKSSEVKENVAQRRVGHI